MRLWWIKAVTTLMATTFAVCFVSSVVFYLVLVPAAVIALGLRVTGVWR